MLSRVTKINCYGLTGFRRLNTGSLASYYCKKFAPVSELVWESYDPVAGPGEIVVNVKAAGLNYPDNLIVQGLYQFQPERPFSPGHEGSGVVSWLG